MNVEIETEAAQFPETEHINGIFVAVWLGQPQRQLQSGGVAFVILFPTCTDELSPLAWLSED
jgi:hypothetical protein